MGDIKFDCPLCCNKSYDTKQDLIDHLDQALGNLYCPICKNKWTSLANLIEHLSLDNCTPDNTVHTVLLHDTIQNNIIENSLENSNSNDQTTENENSNENFSKCNLSVGEFETATDANDSKMYVELLGRQLMKPCLQTQELKLVKENGESRYLIVTQEDGDLSVGTVVTKQNNDGTISLTTVKDMKIESDTMIENMDNEQEDNQDEIYSCNTCGVSFSSVIDHIQNYHNDQEVVVEEPIEDDSISIEYDSHENVDTTPTEKQISRRMITDTGNIVEEPLIEKTSSVIEQRTLVITDEPKKEVVDKQGKLFVRRYVQIDKMCDSVVKDIKETEDEKGGPYHKVVVKEVLTPSGSNVKMYHCMSCNIFVSTLAEFKTHPCKTLKYPCPHCPIAYENSKSLCAHMKVHKIKSDEYSPAQVQPLQTTYECELCNTVFPSNKSLKLHKRMHDPVKARPMDPPVESTENTDVRYMCNICNKMILLDYKTIHQNSHKTSDKMNCSICNRKFTSKEYLDMHMNVHNVDKVPLNKQDKSLPYSCLYCSRRFARPHEKVKHERIHTGEKPHSCEICGKSFRVSYCLTLHMRTHTGARPYACQHCGKRFKAHSVYNHHLLTHSEVRAYKCPYCPKAFKTSVQLAGHKNSHTKPFSCQHCNRPFASLYAVRVHTETHARQNNLKFSCSLCGASYARAFALKDHVKQVHKQEIDNVDHLDTSKTNVKEDWMIKLGADTEDINTPSKDLPAEITQLDGHNDELIVPN